MKTERSPEPSPDQVPFSKWLREFLIRRGTNAPTPDAETAKIIEAFGANLGWPETEQPANLTDPVTPTFANPVDQKRAILGTAGLASTLLNDLRAYAAKGDEAALSEYVQLLVENVNWLEGYASRDKGNLKAMARISNAWPVVWAHRSQRKTDVTEYLKRIELTQDPQAQISLSPKWGMSWGNKGNPAAFYAQGIRDLLGEVREFVLANSDILPTNGPLSRDAWENLPQWVKDAGKLRPLTKKSAPRWFKIGWQLLCERHKGHPENDPTLRNLCDDFRANKYARRYVKIAGPFSSKEIMNRKKSPPRTAAADIRSRIKERICQALVSLAP